MKFAFIDNNRVEANPKQVGICICCSKPVISKCGNRKVWHWAHKSLLKCDKWWESETEWHRKWKNYFPTEWQEKVHFDENTNEKHIADLLNNFNLVVEFQHSFISSVERQARERFYKNMIWVVDGTRLQRDYSRFQKQFSDLRRTKQQGVYIADFIDEVFPKDWLKSSVTVIFDFKGLTDGQNDKLREILWCILPQTDSFSGVIVGFERNDFIQIINSRGHLFPVIIEEYQDKTIRVAQPKLYYVTKNPTNYLHKGKWLKIRRRF